MAQKAKVTFETHDGRITRIESMERVEINDGGHYPLAVYTADSTTDREDPDIYAYALNFDVKADE